MKNKVSKYLFGAIVLGMFTLNMFLSFNDGKSPVSLSSLMSINQANAEDPDFIHCYWSYYEGGDSGPFYFCGYEVMDLHCTCGSFC